VVLVVGVGVLWVLWLGVVGVLKKFLQERLNLWWPRVMNTFGKSTGQGNDIYQRLGLKTRSNADVRAAFVKEITDKCAEWGLVVPKYDENVQPTEYVA
jgi:ring-1,2-phenylacetyl-CoA epoxidase subunit PaaA